MRAQMGIAEPNYGVLLEGSLVAAHEVVPSDRLIHPRVEPEVTFLMARDLAGADLGHAEAWEAVEAVFPSIEIVDTRYEDYAFTALDNIADNSSAARFVLGDRVEREAAGDLRAMTVRLEQDGAEIDRARGGDAMGDPVLALAWLANKLAESGRAISAGALVMTGGLTRAHAAPAGARFCASFDGLGTVAAQF
jgi:2-keto-4-pentenoate hydratase